MSKHALPSTGTRFAITGMAHQPLRGTQPCAECLAHVDAAIAQARATGARSVTYGAVPTNGDAHTVTVSLVLAVAR